MNDPQFFRLLHAPEHLAGFSWYAQNAIRIRQAHRGRVTIIAFVIGDKSVKKTLKPISTTNSLNAAQNVHLKGRYVEGGRSGDVLINASVAGLA